MPQTVVHVATAVMTDQERLVVVSTSPRTVTFRTDGANVLVANNGTVPAAYMLAIVPQKLEELAPAQWQPLFAQLAAYARKLFP